MPLELIGVGTGAEEMTFVDAHKNDKITVRYRSVLFLFFFLDLEYVKRRFGALLIFGELRTEEWADGEFLLGSLYQIHSFFFFFFLWLFLPL